MIHIEIEFFRTTTWYTLFDHTTNEEFLGEVKAEPADMKLKRYKSYWL
jgi:hypothetical protein